EVRLMNGKWAGRAGEMPNNVGVSCQFQHSRQIVDSAFSFLATCSDLPKCAVLDYWVFSTPTRQLFPLLETVRGLHG
ncbi:MAG: hypothetical protein Q8O58_01335, partial [Gallionella sp.]|nr:hypothetical protein [Gallionella sp.]